MDLETLKKCTAEFLHSYGLKVGNLDYINEQYLHERKTALKATRITAEIGDAKIDPEKLEGNKRKAIQHDQVSIYVYGISDDGTTLTYYTSCNVVGTPQYSVLDSQIVSLKDIGTCGIDTLYDLVYNE